MYLNKLSDEQRLAFLSISQKLINADGILDRREQNAIDMMRIEMGLYEEAKLPTGSIEDIVSVFDSKSSKVYSFIEWLALSYADNNFSGEEQKILRAIAVLFELNESKATELENWVISYNDLIKKVDSFIPDFSSKL